MTLPPLLLGREIVLSVGRVLVPCLPGQSVRIPISGARPVADGEGVGLQLEGPSGQASLRLFHRMKIAQAGVVRFDLELDASHVDAEVLDGSHDSQALAFYSCIVFLTFSKFLGVVSHGSVSTLFVFLAQYPSNSVVGGVRLNAKGFFEVWPLEDGLGCQRQPEPVESLDFLWGLLDQVWVIFSCCVCERGGDRRVLGNKSPIVAGKA